ncbi:MAG TPA: Uma2 family endonuclease [Isosphaeraceae bacterium]|nr:Uma2 family endonuclease [Isosphaeraceae bacterium]
MAQTRATKTLTPRLNEIEYPESDGKPFGETSIHVNVITQSLLGVIQGFYKDNPNVAVHSNLLVYYVEDDPKRNVCPDLFVAFKVPSDIKRRTFKVWDEGKGPDLVIEVTSKKTRREDTGRKFELYRDVLKVREYFLFDPFEEYLEPSLQGHRLRRGRYKPIAAVENRLPSEVLGLHLERNGFDLRLYNPQTGVWLPTRMELEEELGAVKADRQQAEAEIQRLRREIDSLRKKRPE